MLNRRFLCVLAGACLAAAPAMAAEVPRPSPDFAVDTINNGQKIHLSQYKGKVCVLAFILTTCPHCQKTVGYLSALQNEFAPRGLQVLASATEDMAAMNLPDFIQRFHPTFPVGFNNYNVVLGFLQHDPMFKLFMPQLVFIDRQGTIRAQYGGDDKFFAEDQEKHLRDQIETLLKEGQATEKKHPVPPPVKKAS
ncbi:MAG TPA: TlpA disulfide reductase family protein [Bryobacteraceae bacterium]|nr:TlpA disulfide reductase family protein [Bryobacteraceae bacterium]